MVEKKHYRYDDKERKNGIWVNADKWTVNEWAVMRDDDDDERENYMHIAYEDRIYRGRNYWLFGILAEVRCSPDRIISVAKGIPHDASKEVRKEIEDMNDDGHSHSYLTLKELKDYPWHDLKQEYTEFFTQEEIDDLKAKRPNDIISIDDKGTMFSPGQPQRYAVTYMATYAEMCRNFVYGTIPKMEALMTRRNDTEDDVRLVFFFDN